MKKETLATGGAIGLSVLIASCCIAPTLFLVFGVSIGALGTLSALEPISPTSLARASWLWALPGTRSFGLATSRATVGTMRAPRTRGAAD